MVEFRFSLLIFENKKEINKNELKQAREQKKGRNKEENMKLGFGILAISEAFNYEKDWAITERGPSGSSFGYSLDFDADSIFVGAPNLESEKNGKTGGVFKCSFGKSESTCAPIFEEQLTREYNNSMFGMVLSSDNGFLVTCAPKFYKEFSSRNQNGVDSPIQSLTGSCLASQSVN